MLKEKLPKFLSMRLTTHSKTYINEMSTVRRRVNKTQHD